MRMINFVFGVAVALSGVVSVASVAAAQPPATAAQTRASDKRLFEEKEAEHKKRLDAERAAAPAKLAARDKRVAAFQSKEAAHKARLESDKTKGTEPHPQ